MMGKIPISALITTKNEAHNLPRCLAALQDFDEIIVVDSHSDDGTAEAARALGANVVEYEWNGAYPKKRQWCLDHLDLKHDWIFFVDGDEEVTPDLIEEIRGLDWRAAGYFVKGRYVWNGKALRFGVQNNKLALFDRRKIEFPVVDDLDIPGMGEIEGHYQPVLKDDYKGEVIGQLKAPLLHHAFEDKERWQARHKNYARWESEMIRRDSYPKDPIKWRQALKTLWRRLPFRALIYFIYAYFGCLGVLDLRKGLYFAITRSKYYFSVR